MIDTITLLPPHLLRPHRKDREVRPIDLERLRLLHDLDGAGGGVSFAGLKMVDDGVDAIYNVGEQVDQLRFDKNNLE